MRFLILLLIPLVFTSCYPGVKGNGNVTKRSITVSDFDEIDINGAFEIYVRQGDRSTLEIEMDENLFDYLDVEEREGELDISTKRRILKSEARNIFITVEDLHEISLNGANELETRGGLRGAALRVNANGASEVKIEFDGELLHVEANGGSELRFKGSVNDLEVEVNGAAEIEAMELRALRADLDVNGAADVQVWVQDELDIEANGASEIQYRGNPQVHKETHGASSVKRIDR